MSKNWFSRSIDVIRQSLNGEQTDYTKGSIRKAVILLAIPMILELSLESVFAVVDIFFVSKLGRNAITTVGLTESLMFITYSLAIGLSTAATAIIARRVGEKNYHKASEAALQTLLISIILGIILSVLGLLFAPQLLGFMGADIHVVAEGANFTRLILLSCIVIVLLFVINGIFRGAGNAAMAMKSLWIANLVNIILCPILIHFWGLEGAAIATIIGRSTGVIYQFYYLLKGDSIININKIPFNLDKTVINALVKIGWPAAIQFIIASGSWMFLARLIATTGGTVASSGYQIAIRNFVFFILPGWGLSNAAATLVGQNLGANEVERAKESVNLAAKYNVIYMVFVTILFVTVPDYIIQFFTEDADVISFGAITLRIFGSCYFIYGLSMVMVQALNGAGDTKTPTYINLFCFWVVQIPVAYYFAYGLGGGAKAALWSTPIAEILAAFIAWYYFRKGDWTKTEV
jgi:putative MATE family efflux protein